MSELSRSKSTVGLIIPIRNESAVLESLLLRLDNVLGEINNSYQFTIYFIDDGSTDDSLRVIESQSSLVSAIEICRFTRSFGKEAAITAGLERCETDCVIVLDGDLQHPPELIPEMLREWQSGYKIVEGVKASRGSEAATYRLFAKAYYVCLRMMSHLDIENLSDYKLLDREVVQAFKSMPERNRFFRGLTEWLGYQKKQIPFNVAARNHGSSSWSMGRLLKFSVSSLSAVSSAPLQIVTVMGVLMFLLSALLGGISLYHWATGEAVTGFTTVILLLLLIGSLLMVSLGVIGLYIARIYDEIKQRPHYVVHSELKINSGGTSSQAGKTEG